MFEGSEQLGSTLDDYLHFIRRRRWWLLLPACIVALTTVGISLVLPDVYRSETVILVEQQKVPEQYVVSNVTLDLRDRLPTAASCPSCPWPRRYAFAATTPPAVDTRSADAEAPATRGAPSGAAPVAGSIRPPTASSEHSVGPARGPR